MPPPKTDSIVMLYLAAMVLTALTRMGMTSASSCFITPLPSLASISSILRASSSIQAGSKSSSHQWLFHHPDAGFSTSSSLFHSKSSDEETELAIRVSRISTLQTLLSERGAPGSRGCTLGNGDLIPIPVSSTSSSSEYNDLHPHLLPISKSQSTGNIICALRRAYADDANYESPSLSAPWPIVESAVGLPGMRLLSLNSEQLMRRIAAEADANLDAEKARKIVGIYNEGLGSGTLSEKQMDTLYETGAVTSLGYGLEKYVLLRVGPFPDLYEIMANQHLSKGDEKSSLIAAEASNGKFSGFGSTFAFYAKLLASLPQRAEESRDAARMCLRMPLPSMGLTREDFASISKMAGCATSSDSTKDALAKMLEMYVKIRDHEKEDNSGDKTAKQAAIEDVNYLLDVACLTEQRYGKLRGRIAEIYRGAGMNDMASFVER